MTIFTNLPHKRTTFLEEVPAPLSDTLSAASVEAWLRSPFDSSRRSMELGREMGGEPVDLGGEFGFDNRSEPASPRLGAEAARARIKDEGLDLKVPDAGIPQGALDILIKRKKEENQRKATFARGPSDLWSQAAQFGVGVGVSLLDPLNVASAFIPIVGPARYSAALAQAGSAMGRAGVRARFGAIEGAAGAAIVEPIVYGAAQHEQADYGLSDSLLNLAFGTVLGGGLHTGLGAAGDALARRRSIYEARAVDDGLPRILEQASPETLNAALRVSVAQAASGRAVNVDGLLRADPRIEELLSGTSLATRRDGGLARFMDELPTPMREAAPAPAARAEAPVRELSLFEYLAGMGGLRADPELRAILDGNPSIPGSGRLVRRGNNGMTLDDALTAAVEGGYIDDPGAITRGELQRTITDLLEKIDLEARGLKQYRIGAVVDGPFRKPDVDFEQRRLMERMDADLRSVGIEPRADDEARARAVDLVQRGEESNLLDAYDRAVLEMERMPGGADRSADGLFPDMDAPVRADQDILLMSEQQSRLERALASVREQARADFEGQLSRMADMDASRAADARLKAAKPDDAIAANDDLAEVMDDLQALSRALGDENLAARELAPFDELAQTADAYGRAVRAAAECGLRRG
jgi:hypothetical protein